MNRQVSAAFFLCLLFFLAACGNPQAQLAAPSSQEETGYLIQGPSEDIQKIIAKSTRYRVLNQSHGLYEVHGLTRAEIQSLAPRLKIEKNTYFSHLLDIDQQLEGESNPSNLESYTSQSRELPKALSSCQPDQESAPQPALELKSKALSQSVTMRLGETVHFSGARSRVSDSRRQIRELRWDVITPALSLRPRNEPEIGAELLFTPDVVGVYRVVLIAEDSRGACGILQVRFLVTYDPEVEAIQPPPEDWVSSRSQLSHLQAIRLPSEKSLEERPLVVAVLDTGLNYNHPAIQANLWHNEGEPSLQEPQDLDQNGFLADRIGWDFINGDNTPFDDEGHGSHVSGLIASPVVGVTPKVKIMPIKVLNAAGGGDTGSIIAGIYYAVDNGAQVINASMQRLSQQIEALQEAIAYANSRNVMVVTSAGNDGLDLSLPGINIYPGEIQQPNILNVAAVDNRGQLTPYSNYGQAQVHVAAPGGSLEEAIDSLAPLNPRNLPFVGGSGTSMAAPLVAGLVARMILANPNISVEEIHHILQNSGQPLSPLATKVRSGAMIDVQQAQEMALELHRDQHIF